MYRNMISHRKSDKMKLTTWSIIARFFFDRVSFASWSGQISFWFIEIRSAVAVSGTALSSLKFSVFDTEKFQKKIKILKKFFTRILPSSQDALHEQNGDQFDHLHSGSFGLHSSLHLSSWSHSGMLQSHGGGAHSSLQRSDWSQSGTLQSHGGGAHGAQSLNDDLLLGPTITRLNPVNFQKNDFLPFCS